jgi:glycylpeptide N-tetradecanoyltransferase
MIRLNKLPEAPKLLKAGLREAEEKDVKPIWKLYERYMKRFDLQHVLNEDEVRYQFLSGRGTGELKDGRREGQVVWCYVVEVRLCVALSGW